MIKDTYDRLHNYLRFSLTDNCNLRCFCRHDSLISKTAGTIDLNTRFDSNAGLLQIALSFLTHAQ